MSLNKIYSDLVWMMFARVICCECRKWLHSSSGWNQAFRMGSDSRRLCLLTCGKFTGSLCSTWRMWNKVISCSMVEDALFPWHLDGHSVSWDANTKDEMHQQPHIYICLSVTSISSLALYHNSSVPRVLIFSLMLFSDRNTKISSSSYTVITWTYKALACQSSLLV